MQKFDRLRLETFSMLQHCEKSIAVFENFFPNEQISLSAEGEGPKDVDKETQQLERAFKPMPFLAKFWEMQVRVYSTEITHQQGSSLRQEGQFLHYPVKCSSLFSYSYSFPLNWITGLFLFR